MQGPCSVDGSVGVSGMSTSLGGLKEAHGSPWPWPKELITLGPEESAHQVVLQRIQELSDLLARVISAALAQDFPEEYGIKVIAEPGHFYVESVCTAAVNIIAKKAVLEPGGSQKLVYYLNDGHYGSFRICHREPDPRVPIVVKVRGPHQPQESSPLPPHGLCLPDWEQWLCWTPEAGPCLLLNAHVGTCMMCCPQVRACAAAGYGGLVSQRDHHQNKKMWLVFQNIQVLLPGGSRIIPESLKGLTPSTPTSQSLP
uniref:ornithine decarboxylase-like n=1 Tax=Callithrix jacchus TaxID=9483 RepID=UPI00159F64E3|nr:ornithine decarboxylase-like [Callithrix jacchus]